MKKLFIIIVIILLFSGCGDKSTDNDNFTVYTSFYAMEKLTEMVAGDKAEVMPLIPSGVDAHEWEPGTADMVALSKADVFIYSGMGMEPWAEKIIDSVDNSGLIVVEASKGIDCIKNGESTDPHVWLNPQNALKQLESIAEALVLGDTENAEYYKANFEMAKAELIKLDAEFTEAVRNFTEREIVVTHGAFGYLCEAYGLVQYIIEGIAGESDPSAVAVKEVIDHLNGRENAAVFYVSAGSDTVAKAVANETGAGVYSLNTFGNGNGEGYIEVMRENLETLKEALNG